MNHLSQRWISVEKTTSADFTPGDVWLKRRVSKLIKQTCVKIIYEFEQFNLYPHRGITYIWKFWYVLYILVLSALLCELGWKSSSCTQDPTRFGLPSMSSISSATKHLQTSWTSYVFVKSLPKPAVQFNKITHHRKKIPFLTKGKYIGEQRDFQGPNTVDYFALRRLDRVRNYKENKQILFTQFDSVGFRFL